MNTETLSTLEYMSPETISESVYYKESDIYSFGVLAFEVLVEKDFSEHKGYKFIEAVVTNGYIPELADLQSFPEIQGLLKACWSKNWKSRPSFDVICVRLKEIQTKYKINK